MSSKTSYEPRRSKSTRNINDENTNTVAHQVPLRGACHEDSVPSREATGKRQRNPSDKVKEQQAIEAEKMEAVQIKKERKAHRERNCRVIDDSDDEDDNEKEAGDVDTLFTTREVQSKASIIKEKAFVQRNNQVPLSQVRNDTPRHPDDATDNNGNKRRSLSPKPNADAPNKKSSRSKVSDYDESTQVLLTDAIHEFRCKISAIYAFPDTIQVMEFAVDSWKAACDRHNIDMRLTPQMAKVIAMRVWQLRGEIKTKCRPLVEAFYGFESGEHPKIQDLNRQKAVALKFEHQFTYKVFDPANPMEKTGLFKSKIIQKIANTLWFRNKTDEGIVFDDYFDPLTTNTMALILTGIECCIDEWISGTRTNIEFGMDYEATYEKHIKELDRFGQRTKQHDLLAGLLIKLYNRGRFHAGVQPISTIGLPVIPDSAFDAAMREYEEDPKTDTDGEHGNSD